MASYSSLAMDKATKAAEVAAKLSQTLMSKSLSQPVRPNLASFLSFDQPESINVPSERIGQIIGKGGIKIRELQEKSGCKIAIANISDPTTPHLRELTLTGAKEGIEKCKQLLKELFAQVKIREGGTPDRTIEIPINSVGLVIGKGGETVRKIIQETNCIVQVQKHEDFSTSGRNPPKPGFQNVYMSGDPASLDQAEKTIRDLVAGAKRAPLNNVGGHGMPPYGMQQPYPQPYGMPPVPYGNNYAPLQNQVTPQPYHPYQMNQPPNMYNPQANPQAQSPIPQALPQAQRYSPYGQPLQAQPYSQQVPYNPAQHTGPPGQAPPQMQGYGAFAPGAPASQTPYNPAQSHNYTQVGQYAPNQSPVTGQPNAQHSQIPGQMNGQLHQAQWQPNLQPNTQQNTNCGQEKNQLNQISGQ